MRLRIGFSSLDRPAHVPTSNDNIFTRSKEELAARASNRLPTVRLNPGAAMLARFRLGEKPEAGSCGIALAANGKLAHSEGIR